MELRQYIRLLRRWWWLLALAGIIGGAVSFAMKLTEPNIYNAYTIVAIGSFFQTPNPNPQDISTSVDLAQTYLQLVRTRTVLEATIEELDVSLSAGALNSMLSTDRIAGTSFLELNISSTDPILATDLANELAQQMILASPTNISPEDQAQIDRLRTQIDSLTNDISDLREQLELTDTQLDTGDLTVTQRRDLQLQRITLVDQINATSDNIGQFTSIVTSIQNRTNSIKVLEPAQIPRSPQSKNTVTAALFGAFAAMGTALGLILVVEYLNSVFYSTDDVSQILQVTVLGSISQYGGKVSNYEDTLLTNHLNTRTPDEYRIIRANLLYSSESAGIYIITSSTPDEGKTTIISNLAISLAMSGLQVLLIDADLRKPQIHRVFDLKNDVGLTSLLTGEVIIDLSKDHIDTLLTTESPNTADLPRWQDIIQTPQNVDNLWVLTSGLPVNQPTELLGSTIMKSWIESIQRNLNYDIILIDAPPILGFTDSAVMSVSLGAKVIPVVRANKTRHDTAKKMLAQLAQIRAEVAGVVLNQTNPRDEYAQNYDYYLNYYSDQDK